MLGDRGLSFLAHSSPGNGLLACKKRRVIPASSSIGYASDDKTGKGTSHILFQTATEANLRPFGAPPSKGRRECPREPLPLEGAAERSEAGLASFFAAKPPSLSLPHAGKALFRKYRYPHPTSAPSGHLLPEEGGFPYGKSFSRIVIPKSPSVLWYNMTRRMTRS